MEGLVDLATSFGERVTNNLSQTFSSLTVQQWIRLVAVVGAYLLLRPYIIKLGAKVQMKEHEKQEDQAAEEQAKEKTIDGRKVVLPEESDSDDDDGDGDGDVGKGQAASGSTTSAADWGKKARRRQRNMVKKMLAEHERKLQEQQEDEEDKDIQEFLVD